MLKFGAGFATGFAALFVLMLIFGDYSDTPAQAVIAAPNPTSAPSLVLMANPTTVPASQAPTVDLLFAAFAKAGIQVTDIDNAPVIEADSPLPRSFRQNAAWHDVLLGDKGGQLFVCDSPDMCVALSSYFRMLIGLAGPYIYTSPSGLVVLQLNSMFTPDQAVRYQNALIGY